MSKKNYYDILGIGDSATEDEIKAAYRKLARKYHPDVSKEANAEEKFKELGKAYETLKDPAKKKQYDEMLKYNLDEDKYQQTNYNNQFSEQNPFSYFYSDAPSEEYSDIFEHIFNREQPKDVHAMLEISIEEAFHGCEKIVNLTLDNKQIKQLKIKIPPGLLDKSHIRLKEQGGLSKNNKPRDLYLEINITKHPFFNLQDQNIFLSVPVLPWEAVLGKAISVPTLYGPVQVKLPKNLKNGQKLRLKGKGFPGKIPGDQFITAMIENPENLDQKIISLYQELDSYCKNNPRKKLFGDL